MIPYGKQTIDEGDIRAVAETLESVFLTTGPKVKEFEEKFAAYVGAKHAVVVSNGTAALHLACLATEMQPGDELITSPMTFAASANCALYCGAKPVFVDIKEENGLLDEGLIEAKITSKTKIIIPVHYAGLPCNMAKIKEIAEKYKLTVIEDACHALGAEYKGTRIGDCAYSDMAVFSFHPVKHITTGEGGMITTNSEKVFKKLMLLRSHGITKDPQGLKSEYEGPWYYEMQELGFNYRITDFQCALGISQLKKIETFVKRRIEVAKKYDNFFKTIDDIEPMEQSGENKNAYHLYVIKVKNKAVRLELFNHLKENEIFCQVHYIPVYQHPYYQKLGYEQGICPQTEAFYDRIISLPIYPSLSDDEQEKVLKIISKFYER